VLDRRDLEILEVLQNDARATYADVGARVGLSASSVHHRVRKLEESGVIRGYRADVALPGTSAAHRARVGIVIRTADVAGYVRRLSAMPGVSEIESVTGEYDLMVLVTAPSAGELDEVLDGIQKWRETVRTTTWVVLTRYR
jgi:DNA-binding Lrp family transcriptional regulator